jgi:hypothetical protein
MSYLTEAELRARMGDMPGAPGSGASDAQKDAAARALEEASNAGYGGASYAPLPGPGGPGGWGAPSLPVVPPVVPAPAAGGGGGGGGGKTPSPPKGGTGGGGAAAAPKGAYAPANPFGTGADMASEIERQLMEMMKSPGTRYNKERMEMLTGELLSQRAAAKRQGLEGIREENLRRGITSSPFAAGATGALLRGTSQDFTKGYVQLMEKKIDSDYQDRVQALNMSKDFLNDTRQAWLAAEGLSVDRARIAAQLQLGYANIANAMGIATLQAKNAMDMLHESQAWQAAHPGEG